MNQTPAQTATAHLLTECGALVAHLGDIPTRMEAVARDLPTPVPSEVVELEGAPGLLCLGCLVEAHTGQRTTPNPAWTIVNGTASCREHLQFQDGPVMPDRTPGGIVLPGQINGS